MTILLTLLAGCAIFGGGACTDEAIASVTVTPTLDGNPYPAVITATDDAGNPVTTECSPTQAGDSGVAGDGCTSWLVGWEVSGTIHIHAEAVDDCNTGEADVDVTVELDDSECHVVPQAIDLPITNWTDIGCVG